MIEITTAHQASGLPDNYRERQLTEEILHHWSGFLLCSDPRLAVYRLPFKGFP